MAYTQENLRQINSSIGGLLTSENVRKSITTDSFKNEEPLRLPEQLPTSGARDDINTIVETSVKQRQEEEKKLSSSRDDFRGTLDEIIGIQKDRPKIEEQAGIPELNQELDELDSQIEAKQLSIRRQVEKLQENTEGLFGGAVQQEINRVTRLGNMELADLSIIRNAADRRLNTATNLVNRKIELALEPLKLKLDSHEKIYEENRNLFNKAEQREFETLLKKEDREYKEEKTRLEILENTKLNLLNQAVENRAPASVLQAIQMAATPEQAVINAGVYGQTIKSSVGGIKPPTASILTPLLGAGLNEAEAAHIDTGIRQNGLRSVIQSEMNAGTDASTLRVIAQTYNAPPEIFDLIDSYETPSNTTGGGAFQGLKNWWSNLWTE